MIKLLFRVVVWLSLPDRSKDWRLKDLTWSMDYCDWVEGFPWYWPHPTVTTYTRKHGFSQQYGRFRARFRMQKDFCFWLLQLEKHRYCEVDHFEIFDKGVGVSTYNNPDFNSQRRIPHRDYMNPHCEVHIPFMKIISRVKYRSPKVREWILRQERRYEIIWRKRFILFKVDGWPCGVVFRHVPRQPMFPVVSGPKHEDIRELEVRF